MRIETDDAVIEAELRRRNLWERACLCKERYQVLRDSDGDLFLQFDGFGNEDDGFLWMHFEPHDSEAMKEIAHKRALGNFVRIKRLVKIDQ